MRDLRNVDLPVLRAAIDAINASERDKLVLRLRLLEHKTYQEISDSPGVCVGVRQVGNILSEGCAKVGDYLDRGARPWWRRLLARFR